MSEASLARALVPDLLDAQSVVATVERRVTRQAAALALGTCRLW